jgi:predicted dehydrogenase
MSGRPLKVGMARSMKADDGYAFAFRLATGFQGVMSGTCRAWDFKDRVRVSGTRATAGYDGADAWIRDSEGRRALSPSAETARSLLAGDDHPGTPQESLAPGVGAYELVHQSDHGYPEQVCLARSFRNRILDPGYAHPAVATFADGLAHMVVILAIERSAAAGRWVDIGEM